MSESNLLTNVRRYLNRHGFLFWKNHGSGYTPTGLPDIMAVRWGRFYAIELKGPNGKPSAMQLRWLKMLADHGVPCGIVTSMAELESVLGDNRTPAQVVADARLRGVAVTVFPDRQCYIEGTLTPDELRSLAAFLEGAT